MPPARTTLIAASAIGVLAAVLGALYGAWMYVQPGEATVRWRFEAEEWRQGTLPLDVPDPRTYMDVRMELPLRTTAVSRWRLTTTGCVRNLAVNDEPVPAEPCGEATLALPALRAGENALTMSVERQGGGHAVDLRPSEDDPLIAGIIAAAFLLLAAVLFLLRRLLHPDRTGTIFILTLLAGVTLRAWLAGGANAMDPMPAFLLSCAALSILHVTAFSIRHGRGQPYQWAAGLLSAALPLLCALPPATELIAVTAVCCLVLWWDHPRAALWGGLLLLLVAGIAMDAGFLALGGGALLCLFRRPDIAPGRLLSLFLLTLAVLGATIVFLSPLPMPSSQLLRDALARPLPGMPEGCGWIGVAALFPFAVFSMMRTADALRAARIVTLLGTAIWLLITFLYGPASASPGVLLPAYVLLAADGIEKVTGLLVARSTVVPNK